MRLYYKLSNLKDIDNVLVHDIVLTNNDNHEIVLSGIEIEGNDEEGRWKGIEIDGIESNKFVSAMIEDALENGYKLTNCMITGVWENHAEITLEAEAVYNSCSGIADKCIDLTPEPVVIEFDE